MGDLPEKNQSLAMFARIASLILIVAGLSSVPPVFPQARPPQPLSRQDQPQATPATEDTASEVALTRYYQERILDTVHWALATSLGLLVTVIVVVVGLGWYTNFRLYQRDLEAVEQRLRTDVGKAAQEAAAKAATSQLAAARQDIRALQCDVLWLEAERWERRGVIGNSLDLLAGSIQPLKEAGRSFEVPEVLEEMKRLLKKDGIYLHPSGSGTIQRSLRKIESEYPAEVKALLARIEQVVAKD